MRRLAPALVCASVAVLLVPRAHGAVSVAARVEPARTSVGVPFSYVVDATLADTARAARARVEAPTGAFETVGPSRLERSGSTVRLVQTLACLGFGCVPEGGDRQVMLPPPRVVVPGERHATGASAVVTVVPRVPAAAVAARSPAYRRDAELSAARLRTDPAALALGVGVLALTLLLASGTLLVGGLRRRNRPSRVEADAFERAVRLLREAAVRTPADRRRAAGLLGRAARHRAPALAATADRIAWSRPEPDGRSARQLADSAEAEAG